MPNPEEDRMANFIISPSHINNTHIISNDQERENLDGLSLGEPSSNGAPNEASHEEQKPGDSCPNLNAIPQNLNLNEGFVGRRGDVERVKSGRADSTVSGGSMVEENGDRPGSSSDGRHLSCKRKAVEGHVGQSSMSESPGLGVPAPLKQVNPTLERGLTGLASNSHPNTSQRNVRSRVHPSIRDSLPPPLFSTSQSQPSPLPSVPQNVQPFGRSESESSSSSTTLRNRELGNLRSGPTNRSVPETSASTSGTASSSDVNPLPAPNWASLPNPSSRSSERLAEYVRRSLFSSESGRQSGNGPLHPGPAGSSSEDESSSSGFPDRLRTLAAGERRSGLLLSEIHNVLDLIRRGEGLQFEDFLITDQSLPFRVPDIHRDMRLDVDNMSYEELLALEERIGNVNTGLSEETILKKLQLRKAEESDVETEPCCVCQEKYGEGEILGTLDCGHDFHSECVKQWLMVKNWCPICKTTGLAT